ncbi:follistatin-A isoform X2 [Patella vulgata]|uniref:follistatin-A isoform X2 n=1 Tax=Patella vulgata TaxID=6465 RepID=UPI0021807823|nr:follistatin-A isoform X2 [Patella vulgata]
MKKMCSMDFLGVTSYLLLLFLQTVYTSNGGTCWMSINRHGLCRNVYGLNMTREECCASGIATMSWNPYPNPSRSTLFIWAILSGGAPNCSPCHTSCVNVRCEQNRECRVRRGYPKCVCVPDCPREVKLQGLVCGSNGVTYRNNCSLQRYNCRFNSRIPAVYSGRCKASCHNVTCNNGLSCLEDQNGIPHCVNSFSVCSNRTREQQAVCGEDGITYPSLCHIVLATFRKQSSIRVAYRRPCIENATCSTLQCPNNGTCLTDTATGFPQCANCRDHCYPTLPNLNVCGTDGVTYRNYCTMQQEACRTKTVIKTRNSGICHDKIRFTKKNKKCRKHRRHKNMTGLSFLCASRKFSRRHRPNSIG